MMKIISGKYKNRKIPTISNGDYRPSTSRIRESIFSILYSIGFQFSGSYVLDLFCGTGSLGFEALSRGAESATFVDINQKHLQIVRDFASEIKAEKTEFYQFDATKMPNIKDLPRNIKAYDVAFLDPPYNHGMISKTLKSIVSGGWLNHNAIIVIESAKKEEITLPEELSIIKSKVYSNNKLLLLEMK